jgi:hypothetical protein
MKKNNLLIGILLAVIAILLVVILYFLVIKPSVTNYAVSAGNQGYAAAIAQIMQEAASCNVVPLTFGNQTIELIAVECLQQQSPQTEQTQTA